jgi:hypothetical protein
MCLAGCAGALQSELCPKQGGTVESIFDRNQCTALKPLSGITGFASARKITPPCSTVKIILHAICIQYCAIYLTTKMPEPSYGVAPSAPPCSRGRVRTLQYTREIARRNGRNAGTAYRKPSTKNVEAVTQASAAMPSQLEYGEKANLKGRRARASGPRDVRKRTWHRRITDQTKNMPATATP